jgi:CBS domain-containing protein
MSHRLTVGSLARWVRPLLPEDTLARATEVMRVTGLSLLPVGVGGKVIGALKMQDVHRALKEDPDAGRSASVATLIKPLYAQVASHTSACEALDLALEAPEGVLVVLDEQGTYRGVVTHADLLSAWSGALRPPRIAGMATPLGVYLTTGGLRAGAGNLGLVLTGFCLALFYFVSDYMVHQVMVALHGYVEIPGYLLLARQTLPFAMMLLLVRLSPLSAYHAAEHQTVAAIEQGEALVPEVVSRMPRAHPRCGSNIIMIFLVFAALQGTNPYLALLVSLVTWRYLGHYLQQFVTTRPPSSRQLQNGLEAGKELLAKYRGDPNNGNRATMRSRLWNLGWLQVTMGYGVAVLAYELLNQSLGW